MKLTILVHLRLFIHLDNLDDAELSKIDKRTDGDVEVIDVKLNNRKTKKIGVKNEEKFNKEKINKPISDNIVNQIKNAKERPKRKSGRFKV